MNCLDALRILHSTCTLGEPLSAEPDMREADSLWIGSESGYFAQVGPCVSGVEKSDEAAAHFIALAHNLMPLLLEVAELVDLVDRAGAGDGVSFTDAVDVALLLKDKIEAVKVPLPNGFMESLK